MTHFVFGAAGLTGGALVDRLISEGLDVGAVDVMPSPDDMRSQLSWYEVDIRDPNALKTLPLGHGDMVHHLAARQYHVPVPKGGRDRYFHDVNVAGTRNILSLMSERGCREMIYFSTDMVYGIPDQVPVSSDAPLRPIGPYGESKLASERLIAEYRDQGMNISVLRPRMIIGPGRLGVLTKLFRLIRAGLPVPMIGNGKNHYQMISVFDCVTAVEQVMRHGVPNMTFNLGSEKPPQVRELLAALIAHAGSRSFLVPTPGAAVKAALSMLDSMGASLMYPEQFRIADIDCRVDVEATKSALNWSPIHNDKDMLIVSYDEYVSRQS